MKKSFLKKWHKIILGIIFFFAVILFSVPRVAKWYIVKQSMEIIGRKIEIGKIRLNYFNGTLRIYDLRLFEADGKTTFASFSQLKVNLDYIPLLRKEIFVKYISLQNPYAQVIQDGSKFNFSDLTEPKDSTAAKADTVQASPMKYIINNIGIAGGYVKYTDLVLDHTIALDKLDLNIPGFTWNSDSTNLIIDFRFVDGGGLYSSLELNQADSTYSVNLKLDSINLGIVEPYAKNSLYISSLKGFLSNDLKIKGRTNSIMQMTIRGVNHIYGLHLSDTLNREIFSFNDLAIDIDTIDLARNRFDINYVGLTDPFILFEMIDSTNNLTALVRPSEEGEQDTAKMSEETPDTATSISYTFPRISLSGGKIFFSDKTMRYPFSYNIENLKIDCEAAPSDPGKLALKMSAGLNGSGLITADALVNPENIEELNLVLDIGQFRMKDIEPYFMHYFGYPVNGGIMNFRTDNKMKPNSLISNNSIFFRKFALAERTDNNCESKIPVRLAIGILSDKDGIIDLKAPVETKGKEVRIRNLGRIIFRIIGNLFVKAAASPFNALAGSYKVDPASLQEIKLDLLESSPDTYNMKSVDVIADIIQNKPGLNVEFYYSIDRTGSGDSLAYLLAKREFINGNRNRGINERNFADTMLLNYLLRQPSSALLRDDPKLGLLCQAYIGRDKITARLDSLRSIQTGFMTNYLSRDKSLPVERFKVIPVSPDTIKPPLNYPAFRIYFKSSD